MNAVQFARGRNRPAAAKKARSAVVSGGRPASTSQDGQLVAKHDDLQFFELAGAKPKDDELQNALKPNVTDRQEHDASPDKAKRAAILRNSN